jgi:rhamnogalacturonan endolyase
MSSHRMFAGMVGTIVLLAAGASLRAADAGPTVAKPNVNDPVTITDNGASWTMDNGIIKATIDKRSSHITTLIYHGVQTMGPGGIWEQTPSGQVKNAVTIDPASNGGQRGEVDMKGVNGRMDIEVRYTMERGVSGIYTYAEFSHAANYPQTGEGESRFIMQLNSTFDWLSVDADRNMLMCSNDDERQGVVIHAKEQRILNTGIYKNSVEHKYSYCGVMYQLPAYGWSSTKNHIGVYFINPSTEYIGGNASKLDLVCHMGATVLDYWTSGHYAGGAGCNIPAGENWNKVIGPIFVYYNSLSNPQDPSPADLATLKATEGNPIIPAVLHDNGIALWQDAMAQAKVVKAQWPYEWVEGMDYPHKDQRGTVTGQFVLDDPQAASTKLPHLTVGLTHPDYQGVGTSFERRSGNGDLITWEHDGDYYQFWNDGTDDCTHSPTACWANLPRPISPWKPARRWTWARSNGNRCAMANRFGISATPIVPPTNSIKATAPTIGAGAGACDTAICSPMTSLTPSARATITRTGSSKRCRTQHPMPGKIPPPRIR